MRKKTFKKGQSSKNIKDHVLERSRKKIPLEARILVTALIIFSTTLLGSMKSGAPAGSNPWGGTSLEWYTPSPPLHESFLEHPIVEHGPYNYVGGKPL